MLGHPLSLSAAFGVALRERRMHLGISQEELARRVGLHRTYVGSVERGERNLSLKNIKALAEALEITASDLVHRTEELLSN